MRLALCSVLCIASGTLPASPPNSISFRIEVEQPIKDRYPSINDLESQLTTDISKAIMGDECWLRCCWKLDAFDPSKMNSTFKIVVSLQKRQPDGTNWVIEPQFVETGKPPKRFLRKPVLEEGSLILGRPKFAELRSRLQAKLLEYLTSDTDIYPVVCERVPIARGRIGDIPNKGDKYGIVYLPFNEFPGFSDSEYRFVCHKGPGLPLVTDSLATKSHCRVEYNHQEFEGIVVQHCQLPPGLNPNDEGDVYLKTFTCSANPPCGPQVPSPKPDSLPQL
jgi:hypothetical protein